ncbi:MAG: heavy metal sensor histidine kinase [Gammaproteobacteria bacterium]|nr:heavy metal sensor histidine kinase [Gammaproteobacteria bacterium]
MLPQLIKNRPASLSLRVTAFVGIATTLCLVFLGSIVQQSIKRHFAEQDAEELQVVVESVRSSLSNSIGTQTNVNYQDTLESAVSGHHGVYFMVSDPQGAILYSMPGPNLSVLEDMAGIVDLVDSRSLYRWIDSEQSYRGAVLRLDIPTLSSTPENLQPFTIVVAAAMDFHLRFMTSFSKILWSIIAGACLITVLAAWVAVRQGHAPIHYLSSKIRDISSDRLDMRLAADEVPVELAELVSTFNSMIDGMEELFQRLSNFSADIAHELRTPITNLTTQTQVALSKARNAEEYREILYSNLEEYERMTRLVNDLLMLAKTDSGLLKPMFVDLVLDAEIKALFDYFEAWTEEKNISLKLTGNCRIVQGDRSMIRMAMSNLLSNAIRHTPQNESITVSLRTAGDYTLITIENPGTEIPAEYLPKIFDRFYQVDASRRGEGAGLGLAIVKSIIDIHDGNVFATSHNGITKFTIQLPTSIDTYGNHRS